MTRKRITLMFSLLATVLLLLAGALVIANQSQANAAANPPWVVAHSTLPTLTPSNSIPGVQKAGAMGAEAVEFDIRFNKSHFPFVIHDATVDSVSNGTGKVRDKWVGDLDILNSADFAPWNDKTKYPQYNGNGSDGKPKVHFTTAYWYMDAAVKAGIKATVLDMKDTPDSADALQLHNYVVSNPLKGLRIIYMANSIAGLDAYRNLYPNDPIEFWLIETYPDGYIHNGESLVQRDVTTMITPWWNVTPAQIKYYHEYGIKVGQYTTNAAEQDVPANWDRIAKNGGDIQITNLLPEYDAYLDTIP